MLVGDCESAKHGAIDFYSVCEAIRVIITLHGAIGFYSVHEAIRIIAIFNFQLTRGGYGKTRLAMQDGFFMCRNMLSKPQDVV